MLLNNQVIPKKEEFIDFIKNYPKDHPVTMVNILKFKDKSGKGEETGRAAYLRYSKNVFELLRKNKGKVIWSGNVERTIIGDTDSQPDMFLIVEYPSAQNFIDMSTSAEYRLIAEDREMALEYGGLLLSKTINTL